MLFIQGQNSIFSLRLEDVSGVFDVEPKLVTGSSQVSIRVANASLDYENPNQRKFIVLVIAEEIKTKELLSSTATLTVTVTDANDNRPTFDQESYSFSVSETASSGYRIASITAKDQDSGRYGTAGIRYSISGTGAELFTVDELTGSISVAECPRKTIHIGSERRKRQAVESDDFDDAERTSETGSDSSYDTNAKKVNLTIVSQTGLIDIGDPITTENYYMFTSSDEGETTAPIYQMDNDYLLVTGESGEEYNRQHHEISTTTPHSSKNADLLNTVDAPISQPAIEGPGKAPCLDFETQSVYFLSYKVNIIIASWHVFFYLLYN